MNDDGDMAGRAVRAIAIHGRVQGVGFRAWFRTRAVALGLSGFVRNRAGGTVEAVMAGTAGSIAQMIEEARRGPPGARVERVEALGLHPDDLSLGTGFEIRPTR